VQVRYPLFWDVGIMDPKRCSETPVANYQLTPRNIPEERRVWWERLPKHRLRGLILSTINEVIFVLVETLFQDLPGGIIQKHENFRTASSQIEI